MCPHSYPFTVHCEKRACGALDPFTALSRMVDYDVHPQARLERMVDGLSMFLQPAVKSTKDEMTMHLPEAMKQPVPVEGEGEGGRCGEDVRPLTFSSAREYPSTISPRPSHARQTTPSCVEDPGRESLHIMDINNPPFLTQKRESRSKP